MKTVETKVNEDSAREALRAVYDPEFGVSVQDLGLIYEVIVCEAHITVAMTLTSMYCPAGDVITEGVKAALLSLPGILSVEVNVVWDPVWTPEMLSPLARQQLGWEEKS